jgi:drug/metabolite transporter (DMT)-like permease
MAARYGVWVWLALATVYLVWGSTFIALAIVIRDLPPFLAMSVRHLIAGGVLLAVSLRRGIAPPTRSGGVRSSRRSSSAASSS